MSVQDVTDLYKEEIPKLFQTRMSWKIWGYSWISPSSWKKSTLNNFKRLSGNPPTDTNGLSFSLFGRKTQIPGLGFPATPYTRTSFEAALNEMFGLTETSEIHFNGCLAGAVAREFNEDVNNPDVLQLFDSKSGAQLVTEVLLGSSTAPLYFKIPVPLDP